MRGLRTFHADQAETFLGHGTRHHVAGLLLRVDLAVIFDGGQVEEIGGVIHGVVVVPELLLPPGRGGVASGFDFEILCRFGEARAGRGSGPEAGIVGGEVPHGRAAHAEAAHQEAVFVDRVSALDGVERFEKVHLACELAGIAVPAVEVQHDGIARREFAGRFLPRGEKVDLREGFVAAVEPGVEAPAVRRRGRVGGRDDEAVGLDAFIDL